MKIRIIQQENEQDLILRIRTGIMVYINWLSQRWGRNDLTCVETRDGLLIEGDPKYEKTIEEIIENAKNGAYEMM